MRLFRFSLIPLPVFGRRFPLFFTHATINLQPPSPYPRVKCGGAPVPRDAKHPNIICQAVRSFFPLTPGPRSPMFSNSPDMTLLGNGNQWSPKRSSANLLVRPVVSMLFTPGLLEGVFTGEDAVDRRLAPGSQGFEATSCGVLYGAAELAFGCHHPGLQRQQNLPSGGRTAPASSA